MTEAIMNERTSSGSPYREPGAVDGTTVECAKVHEAGETKRRKIDAKEKRVKDRRDAVLDWWNSGDFAKFLTLVSVLLVGGTIVALLIMYANHRWFAQEAPTACVDEVRSRHAYSAASCTHPLHVLVSDADSWTCKCGTPRVP